MKLNKKLILGLAAVSLFGFNVSTVDALTYKVENTNTREYSFDVSNIKNGDGINPKVEGATKNTYIKVGDSENVTLTESECETIDSDYIFMVGSNGTLSSYKINGKSVGIQDWYTLKGQDYFLFYERENDGNGNYTCNTIAKAIKVDKSAPDKGKMYSTYIFDETDTTAGASLFTEYTGSSNNVTYNLKVGRITDNSIITKFAKNDASAYNDLMNYAKNATAEKEYTFAPQVSKVDVDGFKAVEGAYYYLYVTYDTNGVFAPLREDLVDVYITKAKNGTVSVSNLEYGDIDTSTVEDTNTPTSSPKTEKVTNPKTGVEDYIIPGAAIVTLLSGLYVATRGKSSFRRF